MGEHQFDQCCDFSELLDGLRCRETGWLEARRVWLVREQRRLHAEELAVLAVLDERGRVDDTLAGRDGTTTRAARRKRRTASNLKSQPHVANAAAQGKLFQEQLDRVSDLAGDDPDADRRWAEDGPGWSPDALADELRRRRKPTVEDAAGRRAARELRYWWNRDSGMLSLRGELPDIDGATVEKVFDEMIERMRPAKGQPWDPPRAPGCRRAGRAVPPLPTRRQGRSDGWGPRAFRGARPHLRAGDRRWDSSAG